MSILTRAYRSAMWRTATPRARLMEMLYRIGRFPPGSRRWLIQREARYGGYVTGVPRQKVSERDSRTKAELAIGGMSGGDRMLHHGYGETYARHLAPFIGRDDVVLAEVGILKGSGLAIWCDLFPDGEVHGFDIDLGHTRSNWSALKSAGAFAESEPRLHVFDQLGDNAELWAEWDKRFDVVIDDGLHSEESILNTIDNFGPRLKDRFVYFIEDFTITPKVRARAEQLGTVWSEGQFTVISS